MCFFVYIYNVRNFENIENEGGIQFFLFIILFLIFLIGVVCIFLAFVLDLKRAEDVIVFLSFVALPMIIMELLIIFAKVFHELKILNSRIGR